MKIKFNFKLILLMFILIILTFLLILLSLNIFSYFTNKLSLENYALTIYNSNKENNFVVDKIVFFSSCTSDSSVNTNSTININNLIQYTDIAIFINNSVTDFSLSNTLKSVKLDNFSFYKNPSIGNYSIYYKNLNNFSKPLIDEKNIINNSLDFNITSNDETDFSNPTLYNNCANPITLSYVNSNIKNDYTLSNSDKSITYNGSLLKKCNILLDDINCSFSFTISIENNLGEKFKCPIYIDLPLTNNTSSIYDGSFVYTSNKIFKFYKYN